MLLSVNLSCGFVVITKQANGSSVSSIRYPCITFLGIYV